MTISMSKFPLHLRLLLVAGVCSQPACDKGNDSAPFVVAEWVTEHKPAVETLRAQLDAAAKLVQNLPAESVRIADPATVIKPITDHWGDGENMVILRGNSLPGLPEYGRDEGKSLEKGETNISIGYTGYVDLASAFSMVDKGETLYVKTHRGGVGLAKKIAKIRYVIISREVSYKPGAIDIVGTKFSPGLYEGVAHIVDLQGPAHLGSVRFHATNTGSFESYAGSEAFMLRADLAHAAIRAFHAELGKLFPKLEMPNPPQKEAK